MSTYADYQKDRIGWFFGLSGPQLALVATATLPAMWAISKQAWLSALLLASLWGLLFAVTVIPVHGRSATGWMWAASCLRRRRDAPVDLVPCEGLSWSVGR